MKKHTLLIIFAIVFNFFCTTVWAADSFVVRNIRIEGLQRIPSATVYSYLPIKTGQTLRPGKTAAIVAALYKTGFFEHISLAREGNTLIIHVVERGTIGQIKISGNSSIPTDKLTTVMRSVGVAAGRAYNSSILERIKQSLLNEYYQVGRYNARVDIITTPMSRNRVLIKIDISEGLIAKVRRINIIGNHAFKESELVKQMTLTTPGLLTFFTKTDQYSQEKLDESLDKLRNYYMDRGYLKFAVTSSQVAITPDRKSIYLTVVVNEGVPYTLKGYTIEGDTIVPRSLLMRKVNLDVGANFSRQAVMDGEKTITDTLGDKGYIFAIVSLQPKIDEATRQVYLTFHVVPGKRAYVRHIYFTDNSKTNDTTLRREIQQMEAAPVSSTRLDQSKHQLSLLPYIRDVQMSVVPVPESNDQVDVNYKVTEESSTQATFGISYSQVYKFGLNAGLNQKNFLGTGKTLGINFSGDKYQKFYGITYTDPYFTQSGVRRTINISISKFNPRGGNLTRAFSTNQYSASDIYDIPLEIGQANTRLQLGYGYENTLVKLGTAGYVSNQVLNFTNEHGRHFQQIDLIAGLSRDSRDKAIFPTIGMLHSFSANAFLPVDSSLRYYTLAYDGNWYHPIWGKFIATARGDLAYGNSFHGGPENYPFYKNFYAGGMGTVRGYEGNSLGPKDSTGEPAGGNFLAAAGVGIIFPNYISDNLRTTLFVDGGNVYDTYNNRKLGGTASGTPRYSTGIEGDWLTQLGLIDVSVAKALNPKPGDSREFFQFSLGANFG